MPELNKNLTIGDLTEALTELHSQSDRGAAVIAGCLLDDVLREVFTAVAVPESGRFLDDKLFYGPTKPLATFSAKISVAYFLGLLRKDDYLAFEQVRAIRNKFAHSIRPLAFTGPEVKPLCLALGVYWSGVDDPNVDESDVVNNQQSAERHLFVQVVTHLALLLFNESFSIAMKLREACQVQDPGVAPFPWTDWDLGFKRPLATSSARS